MLCLWHLLKVCLWIMALNEIEHQLSKTKNFLRALHHHQDEWHSRDYFNSSTTIFTLCCQVHWTLCISQMSLFIFGRFDLNENYNFIYRHRNYSKNTHITVQNARLYAHNRVLMIFLMCADRWFYNCIGNDLFYYARLYGWCFCVTDMFN